MKNVIKLLLCMAGFSTASSQTMFRDPSSTKIEKRINKITQKAEEIIENLSAKPTVEEMEKFSVKKTKESREQLKNRLKELVFGKENVDGICPARHFQKKPISVKAWRNSNIGKPTIAE